MPRRGAADRKVICSTPPARAAYSADRADVFTVEAANALYRNAVEDARAGRVEQALSALRPLVERSPERQDMLGDYAVVLGWAVDGEQETT